LVSGLVLCRLGFAYQLWRDWRRHGLTYIAWGTLMALIAGTAAIVFWWASLPADPLVILCAAVPGVVDLAMAYLKARDWICTRFHLPVGGPHRRLRR